MIRLKQFKQELAKVFDDDLNTSQWHNYVDYFIVGLILLSTIQVFVSTFDLSFVFLLKPNLRGDCSAYAEVGVVEQDLYARKGFEGGIYFSAEPAGQFPIAFHCGGIVTEHVHAEIFKILPGGFNVAQYATARLSFGAT